MKKLPAEEQQLLDDRHVYSLFQIEDSNAGALVRGLDFPSGYVVPLHRHSRIQFLCVFAGVAMVTTQSGRWMVPPDHALLIPAGMEHTVAMFSAVKMRSVYIFPDETLGAIAEPLVMEVTDLAHHLILEVSRLKDEDTLSRRSDLLMSLLIDEIGTMPQRPLGLSFPRDDRLAALCREFLQAPHPDARIDDWAQRMNMSRRTFTRMFREQTGLSFTTWRQQACLFSCLPQLASGAKVIEVALEAGYSNVPAFATMFRRMMGISPRQYFMRSESVPEITGVLRSKE